MCTIGYIHRPQEPRHGHQEPLLTVRATAAARARVSRRFVVNLENGKVGSHLGKTLTVMMSAGLVGVAVPVEAMQAALA